MYLAITLAVSSTYLRSGSLLSERGVGTQIITASIFEMSDMSVVGRKEAPFPFTREPTLSEGMCFMYDLPLFRESTFSWSTSKPVT